MIITDFTELSKHQKAELSPEFRVPSEKSTERAYTFTLAQRNGENRT